MRLSTIKLAGFKSFVEPTKIPFPDQMTCVVGPNGCGKSNVIDAVRWVLGESSAKNLRGDAMSDVIFNGSTNRKPISQASVELTFDNTQGHLPGTFADRNQVAVKRLVTRDGQSLYFLNGSKCRKRDITDIFLGTGLGPRSYAIIEQGMISRLIESKPAELRVFLEEAAGVSKYKERRRETQTRIKSTRENLERLLDVRKELQAQLDKLAVQSIDAKKYREFKTTERTLKGQIAVLKWQKLHQQQADKTNQIEKLNEQIDFFKQAHLGHDDVLASLESQAQLQQQKLNDAQQQQHTIHTELTRAEQQKINLKQQQQVANQNLIKQQQLQQQNHELQLAQQGACDELQHVLQEALEYSLVCNEQVEEMSEQVTSLQDKKQQSATYWQQLNERSQQLNETYAKTQSELTQQQQNLHYINSQYAETTQALEELTSSPVSRQLDQQQQLMQTLTQQLATKQTALNKLQTSAELATSELKKEQQSKQHIAQQLNENKAKTAALSSLLDGYTLGENDLKGSGNILAQLEVKSGYEHVVEQALLGLEHLNVSKTVAHNSVWPNNAKVTKGSVAALIELGVYPDLLNKIGFQQGVKSTDSLDNKWLAVIDSKGNVYGHNWQKETATNSENSLLLKHKQLHESAELVEQLSTQLKKAEQREAQQQGTYNSFLAQLDTHKEAVHQLAQQIAGASTRRDMLKEQQSQWQAQHDKFVQKQQQLEAERKVINKVIVTHSEQLNLENGQRDKLAAKLAAAQSDLEHDEQQLKQLSDQLEQYKTQAHQANLSEQKTRSECQLSETKLAHALSASSNANEAVQDLTTQLEDLVIPLEEVAEKIELLLGEHQQFEDIISKLKTDLAEAKEELINKQAALKSSQGELITLQERSQKLAIEEQSLMVKAQAALEPLEELAQNLKTVLDTLPESVNLATMQSALNKTSQQLADLGAVNLAAIDEFEQAQTRSQYLDNQLDDLTKALSTLEGAIQKIDRETKSRFKTTFDQVNKDFAELFPKVFGGGSAYLELTSDDLLESGVSIMARPPGKKNSTIHLLSGGEKALIALSLVFSIFRLNPAPFCMLDEVDAPLDDANVGRFCRLVEEMSQSVQFIYISHNKIAMEMAGRLTGVTMAEPGVSRMVAVDIEQAVQLARV